MSNIDRAAEVIWAEQSAGIVKPRELAEALANEGLLMPDLPDTSTHHDTLTTWYPLPDRKIFITHINSDHPAPLNLRVDDPDINLGPQGAWEIGLALLAAADHAERNPQ